LAEENMVLYFLSLGIYSAILLVLLIIVCSKELSKNIIFILNIILWYTILNFANVFPWLYFGHMNWIGKLMVIGIVTIIIIIKKIKKEHDIVSFIFSKENKKIIIITAIVHIGITSVTGSFLLINNKFDFERFLMNAVFVGISEELYFRGLLYNKISNIDIRIKNNKILHIIICSIAFGIVHIYFNGVSFIQNGINFLIPFVVGIILNKIYNKSKNILVPILLHNSIDTIYYGIYTLLQLYFFRLGGGNGR
jgi:membrane protease YdiL (CAAX protease family)